MANKVLVLVNLGSPDEPTPQAVGRYLHEFLMDPFVIDKQYLLRLFLVYGLIVPLRRRRSAHAYAKIWTDQGSPLKVHTAQLARGLQNELGAEWRVDWAMRYGTPDLNSLFEVLASEQPEELLILPLYPQGAKSSTGTVVNLVQGWVPRFRGKVRVIEPFFRQSEFIEAQAQVIKENWQRQDHDYLLFSFHGLPERHMRETDLAPGGCLQQKNCCEVLSARNQHCYRAQCYSTARALAEKLNLKEGQWSVSFQSRLGREPWIQPFTDQVLLDLAKQSWRRVMVTCPAFVADCLETLEEIGMRAKVDYKNFGGDLELLPALNASSVWVKNLASALAQNRWPSRTLKST